MNFTRNRSPPSQYELIDRETAFVPKALRAEREFLSLIHFLRDHDKPQFRRGGLNAISSDQTLSAPVRQRALQFAHEWKP